VDGTADPLKSAPSDRAAALPRGWEAPRALVCEHIQNRQGGGERGCAEEAVAPRLVEAHLVGDREGRHGHAERHEEEADKAHGTIMPGTSDRGTPGDRGWT